jgi:hypothetical protein
VRFWSIQKKISQKIPCDHQQIKHNIYKPQLWMKLQQLQLVSDVKAHEENAQIYAQQLISLGQLQAPILWKNKKNEFYLLNGRDSKD